MSCTRFRFCRAGNAPPAERERGGQISRSLSTMCATLATMPRVDGVSSSSTTRCILFRPSPIERGPLRFGATDRRTGLAQLEGLFVGHHTVSTSAASASASRRRDATAAQQVGNLLATALGHGLGAGLGLERFERRADHVVGVRGAVRLRHDVGDAERFEHGAHRSTSDDPGALRCGTNVHQTSTEVADAVMVQRAAFLERNADHCLLGSSGRLRNRLGHFTRLTVTETGPALAIADHDERCKAESACRPSRSSRRG